MSTQFRTKKTRSGRKVAYPLIRRTSIKRHYNRFRPKTPLYKEVSIPNIAYSMAQEYILTEFLGSEMNVEEAIVSKILKQGAISILMTQGIPPEQASFIIDSILLGLKYMTGEH